MTCYSCVGQEHVLTIEVDPGTRTIVQAKGKRDSYPSPEGRKIMLQVGKAGGVEGGRPRLSEPHAAFRCHLVYRRSFLKFWK